MGRHGHGLKPEWSAPCRAWLASKGWVSADDAVKRQAAFASPAPVSARNPGMCHDKKEARERDK
eukprot:2532315-Amphidinium_carterae.1